jgi:hypothetical protein
MLSRWILPDIREVTIEGDEHPLGRARCAGDLGVSASGQALSRHGVDIVTWLPEERGDIPRQVLVELEPHSARLGNGRTSSPANMAP